MLKVLTSVLQIVVSLVAGPIVSIKNLPSSGLVLGGALVGAVLCARFLIPADIHSYDLLTKERESGNEA